MSAAMLGDTGTRGLQLTVTSQGRLETPEEFGRRSWSSNGARANSSGCRMWPPSNWARGRRTSTNMFDNKPTVGLAVFLQPDANALVVLPTNSSAAHGQVAQRTSPTASSTRSAYDTTPYIGSSIREVFKALRDSIILVAIVVLVFLQSWRSVPSSRWPPCPVAIVGTFAAMWLVGLRAEQPHAVRAGAGRGHRGGRCHRGRGGGAAPDWRRGWATRARRRCWRHEAK